MYFSRQPSPQGERGVRHRHHYIVITILILVQCIEIHPLVIFIILTMFSGLSGEKGDLEHRQDVFGSNTIPPKPPKTFLEVIIHSDSHYQTLDQVNDDFTRIFPFFSSVTNCLFSAGMGGPARRHPHHPGGTDPTVFKHLENMPCPQQLF